jgi:outer membrane protein assembly factor BamA
MGGFMNSTSCITVSARLGIVLVGIFFARPSLVRGQGSSEMCGPHVGDHIVQADCRTSEARKPNILRIETEGNTFISSGRLCALIGSSASALTSSDDINADALDKNVSRLETYYKSFGYQDVHVDREIRREECCNRVRVIFHIHEGPRFRVASVQSDGNTVMSSSDLLRLIKLRENDYYNQTKADEDQAALEKAYALNGYRAAVHELRFLTGAAQIAVHYVVQEKPPTKEGVSCDDQSSRVRTMINP